jgi:mycothiol synthase
MDVIRTTTALQRREAFALLIGKRGASAPEIDQQIDNLVRYTQRNGLSLEHCLLAREADRNISACLLVDSPGRTSSVFLPVTCETTEEQKATVLLLQRAAELAVGRGVQLLQGMVAPESTHEPTLYREAAFERLTCLLYMENDLSEPMPLAPKADSLSWKTYSPQNHALFAETVQATYVDSLDCGDLNGRRDIEDVLASHRGTGKFDPRLWLMGFCDREPVGVLLLSHIAERWALEVAYMGLLPKCRGQGYGAAMLRRGLELAREQAVMIMTLTVDELNTPARRLYERFSFREASRREAWLRILE